jgi:hypothetical protein
MRVQRSDQQGATRVNKAAAKQSTDRSRAHDGLMAVARHEAQGPEISTSLTRPNESILV